MIFINVVEQYLVDGKLHFGEVYYYFRCRSQGQEMCLAIVSVYSEPNPDLLTASNGSFISCQSFGENALIAISVLCIQSVVAMVPHILPHFVDSDRHFFLVERPGLDIVNLGSTTPA